MSICQSTPQVSASWPLMFVHTCEWSQLLVEPGLSAVRRILQAPREHYANAVDQTLHKLQQETAPNPRHCHTQVLVHAALHAIQPRRRLPRKMPLFATAAAEAAHEVGGDGAEAVMTPPKAANPRGRGRWCRYKAAARCARCGAKVRRDALARHYSTAKCVAAAGGR